MEKVGFLVVVGLLAMTFTGQVEGSTYQSCMRSYMNSVFGITEESELCPLLSRLMSCILNSDTYQHVELTEGTITSVENMLEKLLSRYGIHCDIDIRSMVKHVSNGKPTVEGRCLNQYFKDAGSLDILHYKSQICPLLEKLLRCIIDGYPMEQLEHLSTSALETIVEQRLRSYGISCDIDIRGLLDARKRNAVFSGGNGPRYQIAATSSNQRGRIPSAQDGSGSRETSFGKDYHHSSGNSAGDVTKLPALAALLVAVLALVLFRG